MDTDILSMIACNRDDLSKSENRIASFIAADPEWVINSTISELAGKCHVSPPTISRFCWKLGLSGFPDLKLELMRSITSTPDETDLSETWIDEENDWDEIMGMIGGCYQKAITKTIKQADKLLLSAVCKKMVSADDVYLAGSGDMYTVAMGLHLQFLQKTNKFHCYMDVPTLIEATRHMSERSVVVFFSYTGERSRMNKAAQLAREHGAYIVVVTRFRNSTLTSVADAVLLCDIHKAEYQFNTVPILVSFHFVADLLYVGYCQESMRKTGESARCGLPGLEPAPPPGQAGRTERTGKEGGAQK